jgi:hypothetical protein
VPCESPAGRSQRRTAGFCQEVALRSAFQQAIGEGGFSLLYLLPRNEGGRHANTIGNKDTVQQGNTLFRHDNTFLNRTPGPSPLSATKMTPAVSRAVRMAARFAAMGLVFSLSNPAMVRSPTPLAPARSP